MSQLQLETGLLNYLKKEMTFAATKTLFFGAKIRFYFQTAAVCILLEDAFYPSPPK
jgi:hypothetical protein